jgi:hypothetical protein
MRCSTPSGWKRDTLPSIHVSVAISYSRAIRKTAQPPPQFARIDQRHDRLAEHLCASDRAAIARAYVQRLPEPIEHRRSAAGGVPPII